PVVEALRRLAEAGTVVEGQFRPGTTGTDWCDTGVLRTLRGRSLARLRREVEPVEQDALGRFAAAWHGLDAPERGQAALLDAIAKLEGAFVPASDLESRILPARVRGYDPRDLDALLASCELMWMGRGAHFRSLERFTIRDDVAGRWSLTSSAGDAPVTPTERATAQVRSLLERHGVITRETVRAEAFGGGFAAAYGILKAMEDAGRV